MTLLYRCECGREIHTTSPIPVRSGNPLRDRIEQMVRSGYSNSAIASQLHTTKGVVAGIRQRYWSRIKLEASR